MKPTVSEISTRFGNLADFPFETSMSSDLVDVSSVAKSLFSTYASASVNALRSVDLPTFVYPTSEILKNFPRSEA